MIKAKKAKMIKRVKTDFKKGSPSLTRKGELDFSTKKTSKDFDRDGKREKTAQGSSVRRRPYSKKN
jgi:hypothetical protein